MAATPVRVYHYLAGLTALKVILYPLLGGDAVNASGHDLSQAEGELAWTATVNEAAAGVYRYEVIASGAVVVAGGFIAIDDTTDTYHGGPSAAVAQAEESDIAGLIEALPAATRNELLNRVLSGSHDAAGTVGYLLQAIASKTGNIPANPAAVGSQMGLTSGAIAGLIAGIESYLAGDGDASLVDGELIVADSATVAAMSGKALTITVETQDEGRRYTARMIVAEVNRQ